MLDQNEIIRIVRDSVTANFKREFVGDVIVEPAVDSRGQDALRITIVIKPGAANRISGEAAVNNVVQIQDRLLEAGDERFPIIQYATRKELQESDDPRS